MKQITVSEFKSKISKVFAMVAKGESIQILGPSMHPVAVISPYDVSSFSKREIGTYNGIATFTETNNGKITEEEFLGY